MFQKVLCIAEQLISQKTNTLRHLLFTWKRVVIKRLRPTHVEKTLLTDSLTITKLLCFKSVLIPEKIEVL